MGKYFGTDGFRGEANVNLTVDHAFRIGRYLGWYYSSKAHRAKVVIGKDTRRSSYMFEAALCAGLTASGADAYLLHVTSTPSVSYIARADDFDCGIMISASHNPYYDNGIKLLNGEGEKMEESLLNKIEEYLDSDEQLPYAQREQIGCTVDYAAGRNRYIGYLISLATRSYKGRRIGLDCANGSTWQMAKSVFDALGADTYVLANKPDGLNINVDCGSTHIHNLQKFVVDNGLDVGFAFDGDADRCLLVDEKGHIIDGDKVLAVCGKAMRRKGSLNGNAIVATVMSNLGLHEFCRKGDFLLVCTDVGDRHVLEKMIECGYMIGGEQSGHTIFREYATTGDGELTALQFIQAYCEAGVPASELVSCCAQYPQELINVPVSAVGGAKERIMADDRLWEQVRSQEEALNGEGRILVRPSGTEALIRVMVEAKTVEIAHNVAKTLAEFIKTL